MRLSNVKELFQALTQRYFAGASVVFAQQSRVAKPEIPLVTLNFGNVKRHWDAMQYKHYEESIAYCELNSYFVDSDGLCCSPADSPNWEMWEKTEFCSRGERRTKDGKQRETG